MSKGTIYGARTTINGSRTRTLVTGGTGKLGAGVVSALEAEGWRVIGAELPRAPLL